MGLGGIIGDVAGAFGISKTGILAGALKMVGVPDKAAHAIGLAAELSRGFTKDGFDLSQVNKGALARHALKAFGVNSPLATLGVTAALNILPKGFGALGGAGGIGGVLAGLGGAALGGTALAGLAGSTLGLGSLVAGIVGNPNDLASKGMAFLGGGNGAELRGRLGLQRGSGGPGSMVAALPKPAYFEDFVAAFMCDVIKDQQEKIQKRLQDLQARSEEGAKAENQGGGFIRGLVNRVIPGAKAADQAGRSGTQESRNIEFEMIKNDIQKLSQMQQAMSNILNTFHETAMGAIRNIKM